MKKLLAFALISALFVSVFAGCSSSRIDLTKFNYSIREDATAPLDDINISPQSLEFLEHCFDALETAIGNTPAEVYTFNFSAIGSVTEDEARNYLIPALIERYGEEKIIERTRLDSIGVWAVPSSAGMENDIKEFWVSTYTNADGNTEIVIDVVRNSYTLKKLRYEVLRDGSIAEKQNNLAVNYDGTEPSDPAELVPEETKSSGTLYFGGRLNKTGIFEYPVLDGVDFVFKIQGSPVSGSGLPGGFAGGFEGKVTIDGMSFPLTLDGAGFSIPIGMVEDPSEYYIAFSDVGITNPQDPGTYKNVYFIKKDLSSVRGLYFFGKNTTFSDWFEAARITSEKFRQKAKDNNEKLTRLYTKVIVNTYGDRKEYNNTLAVLFNMFIGVEKNYLKKNLKPGISSISRDIRDYAEAIKDSSVARKGENNIYFFPNGRSMVVRLFEYDGTTAVAAIDFSSKQDDGYGALYKAEYIDGDWSLTTIVNTRIK